MPVNSHALLNISYPGREDRKIALFVPVRCLEVFGSEDNTDGGTYWGEVNSFESGDDNVTTAASM